MRQISSLKKIALMAGLLTCSCVVFYLLFARLDRGARLPASTEYAPTCAVSLCGSPDRNLGVRDLLDYISAENSPEDYSLLQAKTSQILDLEESKLKQKISRLEFVSHKGVSSQLSPVAHRFVNNLKYLGYFKKLVETYVLDAGVFYDDSEIFLSAEDLQGAGVLAEEQEWFLQLLNKRHLRSHYEVLILDHVDFMEDVMFSVTNEIDLEKAQKLFAQMAVEAFERIKVLLGGEFNLSNFYCKKLYSGSPDADLEKAYLEGRKVLAFEALIREENAEIVSSLPFSFTSYVSADRIRNFLVYASGRFKEKGFIKEKEQRTSYCSKTLTSQIISGVEPDHNKKLRAMVSDVLDIAKQEFEFSSPERKVFFEEELAGFNFEDLPLRHDIKAGILGKLDSYLTGLKEESGEVSESHLVIWLALLFSGTEDSASPEQKFSQALYSGFDKLCYYIPSAPLTDEVDENKGKAQFSWPVARFPEIGIGIIAHEIGHYVSALLRRAAYSGKQGDYYFNLEDEFVMWEERECVNSFYKNAQGIGDLDGVYDTVPVNVEGQDIFEGVLTEEDWADYFAAQVLKKMSNKPQYSAAKNYMCVFLENIEKSSFDSELQLQHLPYYLDSTGALDPHSPKLIRAMHVEKEFKGNLPESCQKLVEKHRLLRCE